MVRNGILDLGTRPANPGANRMIDSKLILGVIAGVLLMAGCSGSAEVAESDRDRLPERQLSLAEQEDFEVGAYPDQPVDIQADVVHDVPQALMDNEVGIGETRSVRGYRVQVASTTDAEEALQLEEDVRSYWRRIAATHSDEVPLEPGIYRFFRQPYYRIRLGDFVDRTQADRVAELLAGRFPGAFAVPDDVTVNP